MARLFIYTLFYKAALKIKINLVPFASCINGRVKMDFLIKASPRACFDYFFFLSSNGSRIVYREVGNSNTKRDDFKL